MTNAEKFTQFFNKQKEKLAKEFILSLSSSELKELRPSIKELSIEYLKYQQINKNTWGVKAKGNQANILNFAGIFCLTKSEFSKYCNIWHFRHEVNLSKLILDTEKVSWFAKSLADNNFFNYDDQMMFATEGYFETPIETLVEKLVSAISEYKWHKDKDNEFFYKPEILEKYPETLKTHIWKLFEYETSINHNDAHRYQYHKFKDPIWKFTFKSLSESGKMDRMQLLKECLLTSNRNFNKVLTGWFFDLFLYLKPTEKELIDLQVELFNALGSQHSKIVNGVLKIFKSGLALHKDFAYEDFKDNVRILLCSETKSIANAALMIIDKILRKNKDKKEELVELAIAAFDSTHSDVQLRAAKFIAKHGDIKNENLIANISTYNESLFSESKSLLMDFIQVEESTEIEEDLEIELKDIISEINKINAPDNFDDFVFLASQAFDNNEPYHFDFFLQGLLDFQEEMSLVENMKKLEPAFQRAFKTMFNGLRGNTGHIDEVAATLFIDYTIKVLSKKEIPISLSKLIKKYKLEDIEAKKRWDWYEKKLISIHDFKMIHWNKITYYKPFLNLAKNVMDQLISNKKIELLSTPTHAPYWINPLTLVQRIERRIQAESTINESELCLAIARCSMQEKDLKTALSYAQKNLKGDLKKVMCYLLNPSEKPNTPDTFKEAILQAYFNKKQTIPVEEWELLKGLEQRNIFEGKTFITPKFETYKTKEWNYQKKKNEQVERQRKNLNIQYEKDSFSQKLLNFFKQKKLSNLTLEYISLEDRNHINKGDMPRIFSLFPNNYETLLFSIFKISFDNADWWESEEEKLTIALLTELLELHQKPADTGHIILAGSLLAKPKTVRSLGVEFWIQLVSKNLIDSTNVGTQMGKILSIEFYPLKRFTDIALEQMLNISSKHNSSLMSIIESAILTMNDKPIKNSKKLLEILVELRSKGNVEPFSETIKSKLNNWTSSASLKKVVKQLVE